MVVGQTACPHDLILGRIVPLGTAPKFGSEKGAQPPAMLIDLTREALQTVSLGKEETEARNKETFTQPVCLPASIEMNENANKTFLERWKFLE